MKRKIFSKLLMGALLVASVSSFTSCKDYDDDINGLKEDIKKAALQSKLDELATTVNGVKSTADQALTTANAAATKAELSSAKQEALDKAAEGIKNAATAQEAADAAKKLAQEAKDAAESIDLSAYAKTSDVDAKIGAAADAAKTQITNALANYYEAATVDKMIADLKKEIQDATAEKLDEMEKKVNNAVESVKAIWSAVTNISLYATLSDGSGALDINNQGGAVVGQLTDDFDEVLTYGRVNENHLRFARQRYGTSSSNYPVGAGTYTVGSIKDGTFGKNDMYAEYGHFTAAANKTITFKHGDYVRPTKTIIVRVSPTNAALKASDLKFIDSKGNDLSSVVEIQSVTPYTWDEITRAGSASGLWAVEFSFADQTMPNALLAKTQDSNGNDKLFALAVNNTADQDPERFAVSEYEMTFDWQPYDGIYSLDGVTLTTNLDDWTAGNAKEISTIKGRMLYDASRSFDKGYNDYYYTVFDGTDPATSISAPNNNANGVTRSANTREGTGFAAYAVNNGQEFYVVVSDGATGGNTWRTAKYAYVIRDDKNANISTDDASEYNAWIDYQYEGLNTICEREYGKCVVPIKVTIPSKYTTGDEIAFRLFAVNDDGTLCDPDGIPFSVFVGNDVKKATVTGSFHATKALGLVKMFDINGTISTGRTFTTTDALPIYDANNNLIQTASVRYVRSNGWQTASNWGNAAKVEITFASATPTTFNTDGTVNTAGDDMFLWKDNTVGHATLEFTSGTPATKDFQIDFALTKEVPTADDVKNLWSWRPEQLNAGVYKAVMYPETASNAADAPNTTLAAWTTPLTTDYQYGAYKGLNNAIYGLLDASGAYLNESNPAAYDDNPWQQAQVIATNAQGENIGFIFAFEKSASNVVNNNPTASASHRTYDDTNFARYKQPTTPVTTWAPYADGYILEMHENKPAYTRLKTLIDDATQHDSHIYFDFGWVSSEAFASGDLGAPLDTYDDAVPGHHIVLLEDFKTVYACPFHELNVTPEPYKNGKKDNGSGVLVPAGDQAWNYMTYNDNSVSGTYAALGKGIYNSAGNPIAAFPASQILAHLKVSSNIGAEMITPTLAEMCARLIPNDDAGTGIKCKLISDVKLAQGKQDQDYFTATLTTSGALTFKPVSGASNPIADVPSTLVIYAQCSYGHEHQIKVPFTVKRLVP